MSRADEFYLRQRIGFIISKAEFVLHDAGLPHRDPWEAYKRMPANDHCAAAAAYILIRAASLWEHARNGKTFAACRGAMDIEEKWHEMATLYNVDAYKRSPPVEDGLGPEEIYARDMEFGYKKREQLRKFSANAVEYEQKKRKQAWASWAVTAERIRAQSRRALSAREVAQKVKSKLNLSESIETIRKRI